MQQGGNTNNQLLTLLGDDAVRGILAATDKEPMSAQMLDEHCDASLTTIYRRLEDLLEHQLLQVETAVRSDGNHYGLYEANLDHLNVTLENGDFDVELARRDDAPDRFRGIWDAMQGREK
ncbi:Helix-turn-helix domain-containing protein [Halogranum rubrum]|uniref:Helix-turn-helix domain-containing protein n=3 Tax=Halogranum rubrum TaxID=553466 RepID=A0A1I4HRL8_9EURY|nr:Helix-turn-helix domain-containing protein [Halogranum rubrum]